MNDSAENPISREGNTETEPHLDREKYQEAILKLVASSETLIYDYPTEAIQSEELTKHLVSGEAGFVPAPERRRAAVAQLQGKAIEPDHYRQEVVAKQSLPERRNEVPKVIIALVIPIELQYLTNANVRERFLSIVIDILEATKTVIAQPHHPPVVLNLFAIVSGLNGARLEGLHAPSPLEPPQDTPVDLIDDLIRMLPDACKRLAESILKKPDPNRAVEPITDVSGESLASTLYNQLTISPQEWGNDQTYFLPTHFFWAGKMSHPFTGKSAQGVNL